MPTPQLPALDPTIAVAVGAALVVLGLAFAFWGRGIWKRIMALIGMILGGVLGFIAGYALLNGYIGGLVLALVGAFLGSILFWRLMNIALALVMGLLAAALVFFAFGTPTGTADPQSVSPFHNRQR